MSSSCTYIIYLFCIFDEAFASVSKNQKIMEAK